MYGIYIADDKATSYALAIVKGFKSIETRTRNVFKGIPEREKVAVIRTRSGHRPEIVGFVKMERGWHCPPELFHLFDSCHLVGPGSKYDTDERGKWFYTIHWREELEHPIELPATRINHGRSYTEFTL